MVKYKRKQDIETAFEKGEYKHNEIEELYELSPQDNERPLFQEEPPQEERIVREVRIKRQAAPHMEDATVKPLKLLGKEVIGSLFDQVDFLRKRIQEIHETLKTRERIHQEMLAEIDADVREKEQIASRVADIDERRNFKLDISILRKEKRLESVQYWRDLTELRSELREFVEKEQTESKIVEIFRDIAPEEQA